MTEQEILRKLDSRQNGAFIGITMASNIESAKARKAGVTVTKTTHMTVRKGINYASQKSVQAKVENNQIELSHKLPWGEWRKDREGLLIDHKGKTYIRLYPNKNNAKVTYEINGVKASKEEVRNSGYVNEGVFNKNKTEILAYTVCIDNIIDIC